MSDIVIGWQVTKGMEPKYWLLNSAKPGFQDDKYLVKIPAETIANHTVIIAQSGSGKSYFLGRLIEEILLRTQARCIIFDTNGDFRRVQEIKDDNIWSSASYNPEKEIGELPHELTRNDFESNWKIIPKQIITGSKVRTHAPNLKLFNLWLPSTSVELLVEDLDPKMRNELYLCHDYLQNIAEVVSLQYELRSEKLDLLYIAEKISEVSKSGITDTVKQDIRSLLKVDDLIGPMQAKLKSICKDPRELITLVGSHGIMGIIAILLFKSVVGATDKILDVIAINYLDKKIEDAIGSLSYIHNSNALSYYFGKIHLYKTAGILSPYPTKSIQSQDKLVVVDLPSFKDKHSRLIAINTILNEELDRAKADWEKAMLLEPNQDNRVPTFIVLDEAHNLIPAEPRNKIEEILLDQYRTISAEGRKYGLYLILISQRPDKLDPHVLSECENKALMKINTETVLQLIVKILGLENVSHRILEKCLEFNKGRALIIGDWSKEKPQLLHCAARRTVEGGRNLRPEYWAVSPEELEPKETEK